MPQYIGITTKVNSATIRKEQYNGHEHWVVPSYTLPANVVMNGGLYPAAEIDAHFTKLEGTFAPLGHPKLEGQWISAKSPEGINQSHVGAFNRNVKKAGNRIYLEKWIDIEVAQGSEKGRTLLERLEALSKGEDVPPIHTSIAVQLEQLVAEQNNEYEWVAKFHDIDHDAILLDEVGAATPEQGVGMMVNADQATALKTNTGVLTGVSYRQQEEELEKAARKQFGGEDVELVWVADFTSDQVIIIRDGGEAAVYPYTVDNGLYFIEGTGTPVESQKTWVSTIVNSFKNFFNNQALPDKSSKEGSMPLTEQERADIVKDISNNLSQSFGEALKPLSEAVATLQANQQSLSESLTADKRAKEATMRAEVASVHGEIVANALTGEALSEMHKNLGAAPALKGNGQITAPDGKPSFDEVID